MRGRLMLYVGNHGSKVYARTVKELCAKLGRKKATRTYVNGADGGVHHVGYVVGGEWFDAFVPYRGKA